MKLKFLRSAAIAVALFFSISSGSLAQSRKGVSILGDSYSTFAGVTEPSTNEMWYRHDRDVNATDVDDVKQTWWHIFIKENGYRLVQNNSYSGSTICNTGYQGRDFTDRSFITRMNNLGSPDMIFIFGATNDSWADSPIGEFVWENWNEVHLKSFRPALAYMLAHMVDRYPNTELIYLINDGLKPEITSSIIKACQHYGVPYIELKDIDKTAGHPNIHGMRQIADQINAALKK